MLVVSMGAHCPDGGVFALYTFTIWLRRGHSGEPLQGSTAPTAFRDHAVRLEARAQTTTST
jgi:hypothetical protein